MFLSRILAAKAVEVAEREVAVPLRVLERRVAEALPARDFLETLRQPGLGVIGEIKRRSPSRGPLAPQLDPVGLARQYEAGGCVALSVLTDSRHFGAKAGDLPRARAAVRLPVLRKDFLVSEYQLWEARAMDADALLLIVAALEPARLERLMGLAERLGMGTLVEVHGEEEVRVAVDAGARVVGINNRDLHSFRVDLGVTERLRPLLPHGVLVVGESGISGPEDAARLRACGVDAILVGEALVRSGDPVGAVRALSAAWTAADRPLSCRDRGVAG
ncbi:MAG: indole-3-glycerol phosphate synthase TrpC [Chloroflexota bacterium]